MAEPLKSTLFEETGIASLLRDRRIDLYYAPSFLLPLRPAAEREVICVHDLAWRRYPESKSLQFRTYMNLRLPAALRRASRVVCVSEATRQELLGESWPIDAAKLRVDACVEDIDYRYPRGLARSIPPNDRWQLDRDRVLAIWV